MKKSILLLVAALALTSVASAQDATPDQCQASFKARVKEAQEAIRQHIKYMADYTKMSSWLSQHNCRELTPLEVAVRKINLTPAYVCDQVYPAWLTPKMVATHLTPLDIPDFQPHASEDKACVFEDPISLDLTTPQEPNDPEQVPGADPQAHQLWILHNLARSAPVSCYGQTGSWAKKCKDTQAGIAKLISDIQAKVDARAKPAP